MSSRCRERATAAEEAVEWVVRLDASRVRHASEFYDWLRRSPQNVVEFLNAAAWFRRLDGIDARHSIDIDRLLADARVVVPFGGASDVKPAPPRVRAPRGRRTRLATIAALLIVGIRSPVQPPSVEPIEYATDIGEQRIVVLGDGSTLRLNTRSRVRVLFSTRFREVELVDGEALFDVHYDSARPFQVRSGAIQVRDIGTRFAMRHTAEGLNVDVIEGRVEVSDPAARVEVAAGERLAVDSRRTHDAWIVRRLRDSDILRAYGWTQNRLYFDGVPLEEVVEEFNRYNTRRMIIADPGIARIRVGGVFKPTDVDSFIGALCSVGVSAIQPSGSEDTDEPLALVGGEPVCLG